MILSDLYPLANHLWQSTLCVAVAWLLTLALKRNRAAARYWLWFAASLKFLIPFSLLVSIGSRFGWRTAPTLEQPQWSMVIEQAGRPFAAAGPASHSVALPASHWISAILFGVWLCGFAVSIAFWFRSWRQVRATRRAATPLALEVPIPALSSPSLHEPGVFGIFRPALLLPEGIAERLTPEQLDAIVAHEMCHVRRRDNLTAAIHMLVEASFWFYPVVRWIRVRLVEERERACDEGVLRLGAEPEAYAEAILSVCRFYVESPLACVSGVTGSDLKKRIVRIITQRPADKLGTGRKLLLVATGVAAVAVPLAFGLVDAPRVRAQSQQAAGGALSSFETISLTRGDSIQPGEMRAIAVRMMVHPGELEATNITAKGLLEFAYDVKDFQVSGASGWMTSQMYNVNAKASDSAIDEIKVMTYEQQQEQLRLMVQSLLADRFGLKISRQTQELPVYALLVADGGPKLSQVAAPPSVPDSANPPSAQGPQLMPRFVSIGKGRISMNGVPVDALADMLSSQLNHGVLDETSLQGNYDFTLQWSPGPEEVFRGIDGNPLPDNLPGMTAPSGPPIFTAIQDQLGLKLEPQQRPVHTIVIDRAEEPSAN